MQSYEHLYRLLHSPPVTGGNPDPTDPTELWFGRKLVDNVVQDVDSPSAIDGTQPDVYESWVSREADKLIRVLEEAARDLTNEVDDHRRADLACCLARTAAALVGNPSGAINKTQWEHALRAIRATLDAASRWDQGFGGGIHLRPLHIDISRELMDGVESLVAIALLPLLDAIDKTVRSITDRVTQALKITECRPVAEVWDRVLAWFFGGRLSLTNRARQFVYSRLVKLEGDLGLQLSSAPNLNIGFQTTTSADTRLFRAAVVVIDAMLAYSGLLEECRIGEEESILDRLNDPEQPEPPGDTEDPNSPGGDTPNTGGPTPQDPFDPVNPGGPTVPDDPDAPTDPGGGSTQTNLPAGETRENTIWLTNPNLDLLTQAVAGQTGACGRPVDPDIARLLATLL